jgi:Holliday junction DNA helicase RuvA
VIASLTGTVQSLAASHAVIDVAGVGYLVNITPQSSRNLHIGDSAILRTALIVREDAFTLFGFETNEELEMFDLLRSVTGVGPKSALAILGQLGSDQVRTAVLSENDAAFKAVSGIGPKTAKLITVTLAGKLTGLPAATVGGKVSATPAAADLSNVIAALQGLGWNERAAAEAVREVAEGVGLNATADVLLRAALSRLGSSKSVSGGDQ